MKIALIAIVLSLANSAFAAEISCGARSGFGEVEFKTVNPGGDYVSQLRSFENVSGNKLEVLYVPGRVKPGAKLQDSIVIQVTSPDGQVMNALSIGDSVGISWSKGGEIFTANCRKN